MDNIPVIDIGEIPDDPLRMAALEDACRHWGFFQIVGHGIDPSLCADMHRQMHQFFAMSLSSKQAVERSAGNAWGYYGHELTKTIRDRKEVFDVGPAEADGPLTGATPQWPAELPEFRSTLEAFSVAALRVSRRLLSAITINLGGMPDALQQGFGDGHTSFLRLNYYPVEVDKDLLGETAPGDLGINPHTDAGAITVLLQDEQPGLQVLSDGDWHTIEPHPEALVVNIGDIVQVWSNDKYMAAEHRVLGSSGVARYSAPFFFNPSYATDYAPMSSQQAVNNPARYRRINWGEFRAGRSAGDYANLGEEIQISHFRI